MSYYYLEGLLYNVEKRLPSVALLERLIEAKDAAAALELLKDTEYQAVIQDYQVADYDTIVFKHLEASLRRIRKFTNRPYFAELLALEFDLLEIEDVVLGVPVESVAGSLLSLGEAKMSYLDEVLHSERIRVNSTFAVDTKHYLDELHISHVSERSNRETALLQAYYLRAFKLAKLLRAKFITQYLRFEIDTLNLIALAKRQILNLVPAGVHLPYLDQGTLTKDDYLKGLKEQNNLKVYGAALGDKAHKAITKFLSDQDLTSLEHELNKAKFAELNKGKENPFTAGRIYAYWKQEVAYGQLIRMILAAKLSHVTPTLIKPAVYLT